MTLVSAKLAHLAKEKGFDSDDTRFHYSPEGVLTQDVRTNKWFKEHGEHWRNNGHSIAPTQSELQKWLRDKFKVDVISYPSAHIRDKYIFLIISDLELITDSLFKFDSYEEALEAGLLNYLEYHWEDLSEEEQAKEAISHYAERFPLEVKEITNSKEFNEKYKDYLGKGHYGLDLNNPEIIKFLDKEFEELVKIPGFKYYQIKSKFNSYRFYCENVSQQEIREIEKRLSEIDNLL